jgi:hypothetical protein
MRTLMLGLIGTAWFAAPAVAQPTDAPPRTEFNEAARRRHVEAFMRRREEQFIEIYKLEPQQREEFQQLLGEIAEEDIAYFNRNHEELQNLNRQFMDLAREIRVAQNDGAGPETIQTLRDKQMEARARYVEINQTSAPMTLDHIAERLETMLPEAQAKTGRAEYDRLKQYDLRKPPTELQAPGAGHMPPQAAAELPPEQANPTRFRSIEVVSPAQTRWRGIVEMIISERKYDADQSRIARLIAKQVEGRADRAMRESSRTDLPVTLDRMYDEMLRRVTSLSRPEQEPKDNSLTGRYAPPIDRWAQAVEQIVTQRKYDQEQKNSAQGILTDVRTQASKYREDKAAEFEAAAKEESPAKRTEAMGKLEKPLDDMFADMIARVKALSRSEQIPPDERAAAHAADDGHDHDEHDGHDH